ncbi:MAG: holo-ACP synthase [Planctomycetota bacterium]
MIVGHGVDITEVARIRDMVTKHGDRFLSRVFTAAERAYAQDSAKRSTERLAVRFAAKEAALKALGTGWSSGIAWTDIEVVSMPSGQPTLRVTGRAAAIAADSGIASWLVSLSHTESHAVASVIAQGRYDPPSVRSPKLS